MYSFLRIDEDLLIEEYFKNPQNINHLLNLLKNMDAIAYFAEVIHEYMSMKEDMVRLIYSKEEGIRKAGVKEHAMKLDRWINELIGVLEIGNLKDFARANYEAYMDAKRHRPKVGPLKLLRELNDEEIRLTMGFFMLLMRNIARLIEDDKHNR